MQDCIYGILSKLTGCITQPFNRFNLFTNYFELGWYHV